MDQPVSLRLGLVAVVLALALAGCGRKGPLELPPSAPAPTQTPGAQAAQESHVAPASDNPSLLQPPGTYIKQERSAATQNLTGAINGPVPTKRTGKPFVLDPIL